MEKGKTGKIKMENNFEVHNQEQFMFNLLSAVCNAEQAVKTAPSCIKTKKMYFAGPWFDDRSSKLYNACKQIYDVCNDFSPYKVFFPREQVNDTPLDAFIKNVSNIQDADIVVALVSKKDTGTAWEIGMAYSLNKTVILLGYDETTFLSHTNVMLAFTGRCATINDFANILRDFEFCGVKINNAWEGIE